MPVDWAAYFKPFGCQRVSLPTYAFQRESFSQSYEVDEVVEQAEKNIFELNWRQVDAANAQSPRGIWGILCPSEETAWTKGTQQALSETGVQLVPVAKLQEAKQLDGLLCLWDSDEPSNVVRMAHSFTTKALTQLQEIVQSRFAVRKQLV